MEIHKLQQLLSEMSLQEKIGQMVQLTGVYFDKEAVLTGVVGEQLPPEWVIQYAGSVLGVIGKEKICDIQSKYMEQHPHHIPLLFMADVIHGCRTIFPIPLGQACSFHPELVSDTASIAASEASSEGLKATFSPMIDVSRDPRWGRMLESFGEDPYVNGVMGEAMVDGYQQKNDEGIAACLKHFAGYGAVNAGREYNDVEISQRTFLEQYVKPFPTMKSMGAAKNEANNAAQSAPAEKTVEKAIAEVKETYDFSNVKVEPLFKDMVDFETFSKSDFRAVKVKECEAVPKSKKLLKFVLNDGSGVDRVILSGIHDYYEPEELIGKTLLAITNLPPRKMMGIDSCGMIISATHLVEGREGLNVLILDDKIPAGAKLY